MKSVYKYKLYIKPHNQKKVTMYYPDSNLLTDDKVFRSFIKHTNINIKDP